MRKGQRPGRVVPQQVCFVGRLPGPACRVIRSQSLVKGESIKSYVEVSSSNSAGGVQIFQGETLPASGREGGGEITEGDRPSAK